MYSFWEGTFVERHIPAVPFVYMGVFVFPVGLINMSNLKSVNLVVEQDMVQCRHLFPAKNVLVDQAEHTPTRPIAARLWGQG